MAKHLGYVFFWTLMTYPLAAESGAATVGEDTELPCAVPEAEGRIVTLEWKQTHTDKTLLFYRSGKIKKSYQDEPFTNRVELQDPDMKSGNLGVILQKVTVQDSGNYTCEALVQTSGGERKVFTRDVQLFVSEQSPTEENTALEVSENYFDTMKLDNTTNKDEASNIESEDTADIKSYVSTAVGVSVSIVFVIVAGIVCWKKESIKQRLPRRKRLNTAISEPLQSGSLA